MGSHKALFAKGPRSKAPWYKIEAKAGTAEVLIYDEIGLWGITAKDFIRELNALDVASITLRLNSPGGSVFDGMAIFSAIKRHPAAVTVHVDGLAASIASIIALAGDEVHMGPGTFYMIHDPSVLAIGTAEDLRQNADLLDKVAGEMVGIYAARTGMDAEAVRDLMVAETWYTAAEAVAAGFATHATEDETEQRLAAAWDLSVFANVPIAVAAQYSQTRPPQSVRELEAILRDAGLSRSRATAVASHGWQAPEVPREAGEEPTAATQTQPVEELPTMKKCLICGVEHATDTCPVCARISAERERNREITALGNQHNMTDLAASAVENGTSLDAFRAQVLAAIPVQRPIDPGHNGILVGQNREEERPFAHFGDFLQSVAVASRPNARMDPRLGVRMAATGSNEGSESDGGFLVDTQWLPGILQDVHENDEIISRCKRVTIGSGYNGIRANGVDETSRADGSRFGGVQAYWAAEAGTVTASKPKFRKLSMDLEKLLAIYYATDEVLSDATALGSLATQAFSEEIRFKAADAVFRGTGAGMPLGILNAGVTVSVAKEAGQTADTILFENVSKMWARMRARNRSNAVWLVNQECGPQLEAMYVPVGTAGIPVWMPSGGVSGSEYETLKGRPVIYAEQCSALGDVGDIVLADFSEYLLIEKAGIQQAQSAHVQFLYSEQTFRFTYRVNGQPFRSAPLTPYKGAGTLSPFVTLAARA